MKLIDMQLRQERQKSPYIGYMCVSVCISLNGPITCSIFPCKISFLKAVII